VAKTPAPLFRGAILRLLRILPKVTGNHNVLRSNFRGIQAFSPLPTVFRASAKIGNHVARVSRGAAVAHRQHLKLLANILQHTRHMHRGKFDISL